MPELTLQERLQPSLLDRLTDEDPHRTEESRNQRVISLHKLRESVMRDLGWLLNTSNLTSVHDLAAFPEVARSVLNYGVPDLTGMTASSVDVVELERAIRLAVVRFEPRLLEHTVTVRVAASDERMGHNAMVFFIEGQLWAQPLPLQMFLKTEIDLELGNVTVVEQAAQEIR